MTDGLSLRPAALFGFTPAEARLAARLATGRPLAAVAKELKISIETARTQLAKARAKTNSCYRIVRSASDAGGLRLVVP